MSLVTAVQLAGSPDLPLLVVGPALGHSAYALWDACGQELGESFFVVGWDLPGHGSNRRNTVTDALSVTDLAAAVLALVDTLGVETFHYAGGSAGGAVGLQLLLDAPARVESAAFLATGARGQEFIDLTRLDAEAPEGTDPAGHAASYAALARFDVREKLARIGTRVLAITAPASLTSQCPSSELAHGVRRGRLAVLEDITHRAPLEQPHAIAALIRDHALDSESAATVADPKDALNRAQVRAAGMVVRREVLGDAHVDAAVANTSDLTRDFAQLVTEYSWGSVWTRPGLARRDRSLVALGALIARGHHAELATHLSGALNNGLSVEELTEVLIQSAVYCGVPEAQAAFKVAEEVFADRT